MSDAFFCSTIWFPEPETAHTAIGMLKLSLCCRQARQVLVKRYPQTMRVYEKAWKQGVRSRLVRCNPATDMLVITNITHEHLIFPYETMPGSDFFYKIGLKMQKEGYPNDAKLFAKFRDLVSSWENLAYYYAGIPTLVTDPPRYNDETNSWSHAHLIEGDPVDFEPFKDANPRPSEYMFGHLMFTEFVPYLQSLKRLFAWPHPKYWPELRKDAIVIDDVRAIKFSKDTEMPKHVKRLIEDAKSFLKWYRKSAKDHNALFMDSDEHWAIRAKPAMRVGSFVAPDWVGSSDDTDDYFEEEQSDEDESSDEPGDDDGGHDGEEDEDEGSEDYYYEEEGDWEDYSDTDRKVEGSQEDFSDEE